MKQILNTFKTNDDKLHFYYVPNTPIFSIGDYHIYNLPCSQLVTYKNIAISEVVKANKHLLRALNGDESIDTSKFYFSYNRALEMKDRGIEKAKFHKINI